MTKTTLESSKTSASSSDLPLDTFAQQIENEQLKEVEVAQEVLEMQGWVADGSYACRNFLVGPGEPIMGLTTVWLAVSGVFGWKKTRESIAAGQISKIFGYMLLTLYALLILGGSTFLGVRALALASYFVVNTVLAEATTIVSTLGGTLLSVLFVVMFAMSMHKLAMLLKLRLMTSKKLADYCTNNPQEANRLVGRKVSEGDNLDAVHRAMTIKALKEIPQVLLSLVGIASFVLGFVAVAPIVPLVIGIVLSFLWIIFDGQGLYDTLKDKEVGKYDTKLILTHVLIGLASTVGAIALTALFATGIVPLVLICLIGSIWLILNVCTYLHMRQKRKALEALKQT